MRLADCPNVRDDWLQPHPRMVRHEHLFRFVRVESAVCEPCDGPRPRLGCPTLALAAELFVRPVSARAALCARPWSEMAREARALCQVVTVAHASRSRDRCVAATTASFARGGGGHAGFARDPFRGYAPIPQVPTMGNRIPAPLALPSQPRHQRAALAAQFPRLDGDRRMTPAQRGCVIALQ